MPTASPAVTTVPMNAKLEQSGRLRASSTDSAVFWAGVDSPDRMLSLHSSPWTVTRRISAGTTSPQRQPDHIAHHQMGDTVFGELTVPTHQGEMVDLRMQLRGGTLGAVFVDETQPDAGDQDDPMISAWV